MKTKLFFLGSFMCAALTVISGCKKEQPATETPPTPKTTENVTPAPTVPAAAQSVTQAVVNAAEAVTTPAKPVADITNVPALQVPPPQAQPAPAQVQAATEAQSQGIIDRAKSLLAENKYQDALTSLGGLKNLQLTPEQQKVVDSLKTQIQAALAKNAAGDAASALGGALGEKK